jgi:hypothetical protein
VILKAKNSLSPGDAKKVEEAFAARMAQRELSEEALTTDQATSVRAGPILPQPLPTSSGVVKPPRGRPRKAKACGRTICSASGHGHPVFSPLQTAPVPQDRQERAHHQRAAPPARQGPPQIRRIAAVPDLREPLMKTT